MGVTAPDRVGELIAAWSLQPHPEGGRFRRVHCSGETVRRLSDQALRPALTGIVYLLTAGETSAWHRVLSDEIWHFYEGDPLELTLMPPERGATQTLRLGRWSADGSSPVHVVPAGWWQTARPLGAYALVGCAVGPGFDFADFSLLEDS